MGKGVHSKSDRPQTEKKLDLLGKVFRVWRNIWLAPKRRSSDPLVVLDLFAGTGDSYGANGRLIPGSTIVMLEALAERASDIATQNRKVIVRCVEARRDKCDQLRAAIDALLLQSPGLADVADVQVINASANDWVAANISSMAKYQSARAFILVDPDGLQADKQMFESLMNLPWKTDFLMNYMAVGAVRVGGAARSTCRTSAGNKARLTKYFGKALASASTADFCDARTYSDSVFTPSGYYSVAYPMRFPDKEALQYILIYASRWEKVVGKIVREVFAKASQNTYGQESILTVEALMDLTPVMGPSDGAE